MNQEIQLHDSEISVVNQENGVISIIFSYVYIHESMGVPGYHPGLIWDQAATITIESTVPFSRIVELPIWVISGTLRIGQTLHEEFIPTEGHIQGDTELLLALSTQDGSDGGILTVRGYSVKIELGGDRSESKAFDGETPRREYDNLRTEQAVDGNPH